MKVRSVDQFEKRWKYQMLVVALLFTLAFSFFSVLIVLYFSLSPYLYSFTALSVVLSFWIAFRLLPSRTHVIHYLHTHLPELEYSLSILDKKNAELSALEQLQYNKIFPLVQSAEVPRPSSIKLVSILSFIGLGLTLMLFASSLLNLKQKDDNHAFENLEQVQLENIDLKTDSAYISNLEAVVTPPPYTRIHSFTTNEEMASVPEGSSISWKYNAHGPIDTVYFIDGDQLYLDPRSFVADETMVYYYQTQSKNGTVFSSDYRSIKVKEDQKPSVEIKGIPEFQKLVWVPEYDISFAIELEDDYGIQDAFISATVADGEGESVKFREKTFPLKNLSRSTFSFSTADFEMEPGSELYFYVMAKDNCPFRIQAVKSPTYFIVMEDTIQMDYVDDSGMQVDLMPDFFRSQRQIIIDTEKLIAEKRQLSPKEFKRRSNELGYDQKMLRLKYGQFLGEEAESGIALENDLEEEHDHDHDHAEGEEHGEINVLEEFGHNHDHEAEEGILLEENGTQSEDAARPAWVEELSHSHDSAEENTYFEISLRSKLKAALSVMWDAELHLRLYSPPLSLPYQYEALDYLQEIKNHARIYVQRIGFDPPVIKVAEKRLSGELDEIISAQSEKERILNQEWAAIRKGIPLISKLKPNESFKDVEIQILEEAGSELALVALEAPKLLSSLSLLRNVINNRKFDHVDDQKQLLQIFTSVLPEGSKPVAQNPIHLHPVNRAALESL